MLRMVVTFVGMVAFIALGLLGVLPLTLIGPIESRTAEEFGLKRDFTPPSP